MGESTPSEEDEVFQIASANAGVYYYGSKLDGTDITDIYIYDDDFLKGNSLAYSSALATMSLCLVNASISSKRTEDLIMLPKQKEEENREELDQTITSTKDAVDFSERVYAAGMNMGLTKRDTMLMSLCVEELACYTIEKGFQDKKKHSIDARVAMTDKAWTISLRDDCKPMNPQEQLQIFKPEDEMDNIGLRIVYGCIKDISYSNTMKMNHLMLRLTHDGSITD